MRQGIVGHGRYAAAAFVACLWLLLACWQGRTLDTVLAVYPASYCVGQSTPVVPLGCNNDACGALSRLAVSLPTGGLYYVAVGTNKGPWQSADNVVLSIAPPVRNSGRANDNRFSRRQLGDMGS